MCLFFLATLPAEMHENGVDGSLPFVADLVPEAGVPWQLDRRGDRRNDDGVDISLPLKGKD